MTILVTGATGNVGSAVVRHLRRNGIEVRAVTREAERARRVLGADVDVVVGDLADHPTAAAALAGVDRVFLASGNHPGQVGAECAAIDAACASAVERLVKLSGPAPDPASTLVVEGWHAEIENHLVASGLPAAVLRPTSFMTNLLAFAGPVTTSGVLPAPAEGARVAFVDPSDVGAAAAALLLADRLPAARIHRVTGPAAVTYDEVAEAFGAVLDRPVRFVPVSDEEAGASLRADGLPAVLVDTFLAVFRMQRAGALADVTDTVPTLLHRPAHSVAHFLRENRGLFAAAMLPSTA